MSSILVRTNRARWRLSFGVTRSCPLIRKLVKPIKVTCSWPSDEGRIDQLLVLQAQSQMRTARAAVHRETNAAVGREQARFDLADGGLDQMSIFVLLFFSDGGCQVLDFGQPLANKHHHGYITDAAHPGIADQLWIKRPEPFR